jgi:hypothetical protein
MWRQSMQTKAMAPSFATLEAFESVTVRNSVNSSRVISPEAKANSRCRTEPRPPTLPSMAMLYGGSVKMRSAVSPFINRATSPPDRASPHSKRWRPSSQMSPNFETGWAGGFGIKSAAILLAVADASLAWSSVRSISASEKPVNVTSNSMSISACSSMARISMSQPAFIANLLSARTSSGLRCDSFTVGTAAMPSSFAAITRPWPAMISPSSLIRTGLVKPKREMLSAI